jgi:propionyl-CoA carboxylase alpha subunit
VGGRLVTRERRRAVWLGDTEVPLSVAREAGGIAVRFIENGVEGPARILASAWKPGELVWVGTVHGTPAAVQVRPIPNGFLLAHGGVEVRAFVYTEREAHAARLMPFKPPSDSGKKLLCPMPGLVRSIAVTEGSDVKAGDILAVVEAMKMENVLRAERDGVVKRILAKPGDSLPVDAVIMEFT